MVPLQTLIIKPFFHSCKNPNLFSFPTDENPKKSPPKPSSFYTRNPTFPSHSSFFFPNPLHSRTPSFPISSISNPDQTPKPRPRRGRPKKNSSENPTINLQDSGKKEKEEREDDDEFPAILPRKPRRGRRSEAAAVEDFVRDSLSKTLDSIRKQNRDVLAGKEVLKERIGDEDGGGGGVEVVEEDDPDWPVDAEIGWGVRASEYFEKYPIENVVDENGVEIDWVGEMDDGWVEEINCLEWESFAFHPSPMMVLVFERYNRAADNWKLLKELESAIKVYWNAKDRLPPRTVKIDINIERDLAYALKVRECPQLLFLRGNRILYREKEIRTADELVHMIAYFYYNAKKPSWIDDAALAPPY